MEKLKELLAIINKFLKESFRQFLTQKVIDNLIIYSIYFLLISVILFASFHLFSELYNNFINKQHSDDFPFILEFSEKIFLYFLPIFILFGFLNFYDLEWKRQINNSNRPNPLAQKNLTLSKRLFFSSVLSYLSLKIIDLLFFNFKEKTDIIKLIGIGIFFIILSILVIIQNQHRSENDTE